MPRKAPYTPLLVIFAVLVAWVGMSIYRTRNKPQELVPWRSDLTAAQDEAKAQNKPLLLYFTASWCGPCQQMKSTTFADASVEQALQAYVPVKIDVDQNPQLSARYGVNGIPHFVVLPSTPAAIPSSRTGYLPAEQFINFVNLPPTTLPGN